jgi:hypothetical protein
MAQQNSSSDSGFTLQLCSRCLFQEIGSWINEKWTGLDEEVKKQINEELKAIRLRQGRCIVCDNSLVSDGTTGKILEILEENNISSKIRKEFKRFFCFA